MMNLGTIVRERPVVGGVIKQRVARVAYGRNGNALTSTRTYAYDVFIGGVLVVSCRTLREAKAEALIAVTAR